MNLSKYVPMFWSTERESWIFIFGFTLYCMGAIIGNGVAIGAFGLAELLVATLLIPALLYSIWLFGDSHLASISERGGDDG